MRRIRTLRANQTRFLSEQHERSVIWLSHGTGFGFQLPRLTEAWIEQNGMRQDTFDTAIIPNVMSHGMKPVLTCVAQD